MKMVLLENGSLSESQENAVNNLQTPENLMDIENTNKHAVIDTTKNKNQIDIVSNQKLENISVIPSDESSVENSLETNTTSKKTLKIRQRIATKFDESSDDDIDRTMEVQNVITRALNDFVEFEKPENNTPKAKKRIAIVASDSDEEILDNNQQHQDILNKFQKYVSKGETKSNDSISKVGRKKFCFDNSDSEAENEVLASSNTSFSNEKTVQQIYTTGSKGELIPENPLSKTWAALCDSESSDPEDGDENKNCSTQENSDSEQGFNSDDEVVLPIKYKKMKKNKDELHKMTPKEAVKQREEIRSDSQRMLRESRLSLPYHRPKTFTLKEFLSKRPKFASAVPVATKVPPSLAIKMSSQQLDMISKKLEERHKEVKEFYKSDSEKEDLEDKDDEDYLPPESEIDDDKMEKNVHELEIENKENPQTVKENLNLISQTIDNQNIEKATKKIVDEQKNLNMASQALDNQNIEETTAKIDQQENLSMVSQAIDNQSIEETTAKIVDQQENSNIDNVITPLETEEKGEDSTVNIKDNRKTYIEETDLLFENINNPDQAEETTIEKTYDQEDLSVQSSNSNTDIDKINKGIVSENDQQNNSNKKIKIISDHIINVSENFAMIESNQMEKIKNNEVNKEFGQVSPIDYEFNLDDIEENPEKTINKEVENLEDKTEVEKISFSNIEESSSKRYKKLFEFGEIDKEIENFGSSESDLHDKPKSKLDLLKEKLSSFQPKLSGSPNHFIDLDNIVKPTEVTKLMERFAHHTEKKIPHKNKVKLNIVSVEHGGEIHKETVAVNIDEDEDLVIEEKPGARLQRLRNELQSQIAQRKSEIWQQKITAKDTNEVEIDPHGGEVSACGIDDAILDDQDEEQMSSSSEEQEEVDEEEMDEDVEEELGGDMEREKLRKKSAFVDDEADESGEDNEIAEDSDENKDGLNNEDDHDDENSNETKVSEAEEIEKLDGDENEEASFKKPLKRIVKGFAEDSDEDEDVILPGETIKKIAEKLNRSYEEPINTQDDYIPPYQLQNKSYQTPIKSISERSSSDLKFLTPVSYITGLQNLTDSVSKLNVPSPLKETNWYSELEKKLHADSIITNSQAEAMKEFCPVSQDTSPNLQNFNTKPSNLPTQAPLATQDILNICSGGFGNSSNISFTSQPCSQDLLNLCSGKFTDASQVCGTTQTNVVLHTFNPIDEAKTLGDDQDMIISQLLNEEELEAFKKKFDSPILTNSQKIEEVAGGGIIDSDEDDDILEVKKRKKNQKKLTFSDDESSDEEEEEEEVEEIALHNDIEEEEELVNPDEINYDSEENEVEYTEEKMTEKEAVKLTDFFEDEAELSESDWGSADEDEKDLDKIEFEEGDMEKFDEKQLRTDLERIHMKRMLDEDSKEVKLLQELLLEDGELHGTGRERQFRWKNIDSVFPEDENNKQSDDENHFDDDENEEQWRRKRHEREMFLREKKSQEIGEDDDLLSGSEILKIGHKVMQKSIISTQENNIVTETPDNGSSPALKRNLGIFQKRGSFLNRGEQVLQRLAEYNKITTAVAVTGKAAKNSKNFLFQTAVQESVTTTTSLLNLKRKAADGTPKIIKKLRLTDNLSPALNRTKKSNKKSKAKLFGLA